MSIYQPATTDEHITENDPSTLEEEWEAQRILSLPENLQQFAIESKLNQFNALPSYVEQNME